MGEGKIQKKESRVPERNIRAGKHGEAWLSRFCSMCSSHLDLLETVIHLPGNLKQAFCTGTQLFDFYLNVFGWNSMSFV